jgi:hypothetical protein
MSSPVEQPQLISVLVIIRLTLVSVLLLLLLLLQVLGLLRCS